MELPKSFQDGAIVHFSHAISTYLWEMSWGILLALVFVGLLNRVPQPLIMRVLGKPGSYSGLLRATLAGLLFDLCSHGILLVAMKFYKKGASLGQTMAFLIASPWNSFSLTFIMISLLGFTYTLIFIGLSLVIAFVSGVIFDWLAETKRLPDYREIAKNKEAGDMEEGALDWPKIWQEMDLRIAAIPSILKSGFLESAMIIRWLLLGVILAGLLQTFVSAEVLQTYFGPSLIGVLLTLIATTIIEVCSEGSTPIAAEIMNRANAPGNAFAFLMAGVSTDYTEIMAIKETSRSWKISFFLPLVTLPQIIIFAVILNTYKV